MTTSVCLSLCIYDGYLQHGNVCRCAPARPRPRRAPLLPPLQHDAAAGVVPERPAQVHLSQARLAVRDEAVEEHVPEDLDKNALEALLDGCAADLQADARGDRAGRHRRAAAGCRQRKPGSGFDSTSGSDKSSVQRER